METALQFLCQRYPHYFRLSPDKTTLHNAILGVQTNLLDTPPLHVLLSNVPEDFAVMQRSHESGRYVLRAGVICSAIGWNLGSKLGLHLSEIHAPIPDYKEKMEFSMERYVFSLRRRRRRHLLHLRTLEDTNTAQQRPSIPMTPPPFFQKKRDMNTKRTTNSNKHTHSLFFLKKKQILYQTRHYMSHPTRLVGPRTRPTTLRTSRFTLFVAKPNPNGHTPGSYPHPPARRLANTASAPLIRGHPIQLQSHLHARDSFPHGTAGTRVAGGDSAGRKEGVAGVQGHGACRRGCGGCAGEMARGAGSEGLGAWGVGG